MLDFLYSKQTPRPTDKPAVSMVLNYGNKSETVKM